MTGTTTGQTSLPTATDSDDTESYLTTSLVAALQALANLFESATGHDHTGAGKGKPIGSAGIASGIHLTGPVVDSGGLQVTAGNVGIGAAPGTNVGLTIPSAYNLNAAAAIALAADISPTLVAQANNDQLIGLRVNPTYNDNAKTGVVHAGVQIGAGGLLIAGNPPPTTGYVGIGFSVGLGNGAATNLTALALGTGSGPASMAVNTWIRATVNATNGWIPFCV